MMYKSTDLSVKDKIILTSCMFTGLTGVYFLRKTLLKKHHELETRLQRLEEGEIQKILNNMQKRLIFTI
jgi:hypothetical protein